MSNARLRPGPSPATATDQVGWSSGAFMHGPPLSVVELIGRGTLDAELAALLWLLLEARLPVVVAATPQRAGKTTLLMALLDFLPPGTRVVTLRGFGETFDWLPEARQLGWRGGASPIRAPAAPNADVPYPDVRPESTYLLAQELSPHLPMYTWGEGARVAVRAISLGYGLGATIHADSLEEVFDELRGPDIGLTDDELSRLGVVLILGATRSGGSEAARRVVAAHFVRPVARDAGGHVQRLPPAVLATWDPARDRFEHFAWGVGPELAARTSRRPGDFAAEQERRADVLSTLAAAGVMSVAQVRTAITGYRFAPADGTGGHRH